MTTRIAILSDLHYDSRVENATCEGRADLAHVLLQRAVRRINESLRPDVTLVLGDLLNDGESSTVREDLVTLARILGTLDMPWVAIPGNHDPDALIWNEVFPESENIFDRGGTRFVPFIDPPEPEFCARRTGPNFAKMARARQGWDGPLVAFQHVPLYPQGTAESPFYYTNADEIVPEMERHGFTLSLSGHYHDGIPTVQQGGCTYATVPALCEAPFPVTLVSLHKDGSVDMEVFPLKLPEELRLIDRHVHTEFAYCSRGINITDALYAGQKFGLAEVGFSEHGEQLYFSREALRQDGTYERAMDAIRIFGSKAGGEHEGGRDGPRRFDLYLDALEAAGCKPWQRGLETSCDFRGRPMILDEDRGRLGFALGSVHVLRELRGENKPDAAKVYDAFLAMSWRMVRSGIDVLAHPFRVLYLEGYPIADGLIDSVVAMLGECGVAAEINFHINRPDPRFARRCIEQRVPLVLGSDSHQLSNLGYFFPHLELLREAGYNGDLKDILWQG